MGLRVRSVKGENNELLVVRYWITGSGEEIPIEWLSNKHLSNIISFQQKMAVEALASDQEIKVSSYRALIEERERRRKCRQDT
jgi:hypothetical protein